MRDTNFGATLLEMIFVLALVAVLTSIAFIRVQPGIDFARQFATNLAAARHRAVVTGAPIAERTVPCGAAAHVDANPLGAKIVAFPRRGLLFTPEGLPRTCDGGGVGNTTILLEHRGRQAAVIVSSLGRVRWELR